MESLLGNTRVSSELTQQKNGKQINVSIGRFGCRLCKGINLRFHRTAKKEAGSVQWGIFKVLFNRKGTVLWDVLNYHRNLLCRVVSIDLKPLRHKVFLSLQGSLPKTTRNIKGKHTCLARKGCAGSIRRFGHPSESRAGEHFRKAVDSRRDKGKTQTNQSK